MNLSGMKVGCKGACRYAEIVDRLKQLQLHYDIAIQWLVNCSDFVGTTLV